MQSSRPPKVGSIPTITALRLQLDYGDTKLARCVAFYDDVRIFRRRYFTQDGSPGLGFYHWKSPQHQTGLTEMVNDFLDKEGNGTRYWPDDDASPNHNKLRYSEHHIQIKELMKQLIFRLNQQQYRNFRYKDIGKVELGAIYRPSRTPESPIRVDSRETSPNVPVETIIDPALMYHPNKALHEVYRVSKRPNRSHHPSTNPELESTPSVHQDTWGAASSISNVQEGGCETIPRPSNSSTDLPHDDICNVPANAGQPKAADHVAKADSRAQNMKHGLDSGDVTAFSPTKKRAKRTLKAPSKSGDRSTRGGRPSGKTTKRISPRQPKPVQRPPNYATEDHTNDVTSSPQPDVNITGRMDNHQNQGLERPSTNGTMYADSGHADRILNVDEQDPTETDSLFPPPRRMPGSTTSLPSSRVAHRGSAKDAEPNHDEESARTIDASPLRPVHSRTPSSIREVPKEIHRPGTKDGSSDQSAKNQVNFKVLYRVIVSRTPTYLSIGWHPKGMFEQISLRELLTDLPIEGTVQSLNFTLEGPGMRIVEWTDADDDATFDYIKRLFGKKIRAHIVNGARSEKPLLFEIEIEPIRGGSIQVDDGDEEDGAIF